MASEPKADRNPNTPDSPYATVNETWGEAGANQSVNPYGNVDSHPEGPIAQFSDTLSVQSDLGGEALAVRPPA
jgi:hypothetical protein